MNQRVQKRTTEQMVEAIFALDLDPIKLKLMDKTEGHGWSREQADYNELEYKRFLVLLAKYPDQSIAPTTEVDKFWHGHILDTMKYAEDCETVFGYFLHHFPYFGMRGEEDAANLVNAFMNMQRLHDREFGNADQSTARDSAWCAASSGISVNASAQESAWCAAVSGKTASSAEQKAAWCAAVSDEVATLSGQHSAWCAAASGKSAQTSDQTAAWCAATSSKSDQAAGQHAAWCAAASGKTMHGAEKSAAWCAANGARNDIQIPEFLTRPKLAPKSA
jgi:hypothetical protein